MFSVNLTLNSKPIKLTVKTLSPTNQPGSPLENLNNILSAKRFESTYE
jgi:hypothetical protein